MLEALLLLYAVHRFSKNKTGIKFSLKNTILKAYLLGAINFAFQYLIYLFDEPSYQFMLTIFVGVVIMSFTLFLFTKSLYSIPVCIIYFFTIMFAQDMILKFTNATLFRYNQTFYFEFVVNIVVKIFQYIIFMIVGEIYEKIYSKSSKIE